MVEHNTTIAINKDIILNEVNVKEVEYINSILLGEIPVHYEPYRAVKPRFDVVRKEDLLVFFGGLRMKQNIEAVRFFAKEIQSEVKKNSPYELRFRVVGSNPTPELIKELSDLRVDLINTPSEPVDYIKMARLAVIPFKGEFGFRTRIPELLHMGVDVLTSKEGFNIEDLDEDDKSRVHVIDGWDGNKWAIKILEILKLKNNNQSSSE